MRIDAKVAEDVLISYGFVKTESKKRNSCFQKNGFRYSIWLNLDKGDRQRKVFIHPSYKEKVIELQSLSLGINTHRGLDAGLRDYPFTEGKSGKIHYGYAFSFESSKDLHKFLDKLLSIDV